MNLKKKLPKKILQIDIPIVLICSYCENNIASQLNKLFMNNLYYSKLISTDFSEILDQGEFLPRCINLKKYISFIYSKYNCDLILLNITDTYILKKIQKKLNYDIIIKIYSQGVGKESRNCIEINKMESNIIIESFKEFDISEYVIYQIVSKMLSDND